MNEKEFWKQLKKKHLCCYGILDYVIREIGSRKCPIVSVFGEDRQSNAEAETLGVNAGLPKKFVRAVMNAADGVETCNQKLRKRLLSMCE